MKELDIINKYQKEIKILSEASALLGWDQMTFMPELGSNSRAMQSEYLTSLIHNKVISNELYSNLNKIKSKKLNFENKRIVEKLLKDVKKARKIPKEFVEELSRIESLAYGKWVEAKTKSDFKIFLPYLEKLVKLKRKEVEYVGYKGHPYNALLDDYEEGMTAERLKIIFSKLKPGLVELLNKIKSTDIYKKQKLKCLNKEFPKEGQEELLKDVSNRMGLYEEFSRIDISSHPFTIKIGFNDIRTTTRFEKNIQSFFSTIHESGHALYEKQMPEKYEYNVLGDAPSLGLHESQSRFWENMIGRGKPFMKFYFPKIKNKFNLKSDLDSFYHEVNLVSPTKIRVNSDEVHYCLHIILRFEIELGLIEGSIKPKDIPKIWNSKMKEMFGLNIKKDSEGALQDMHWSGGSFGYFPTYAIGTIYASQIYKQLKKEIPKVEEYISKGDYSKIREWLNKKIHRYGSLYLSDDLIKKVCGEGLNPDVFLEYLNEKYKKIYKF